MQNSMLNFMTTPSGLRRGSLRHGLHGREETAPVGQLRRRFKPWAILAVLLATASTAPGQREEWLWAIRHEERYDHVVKIDEMPARFRIEVPADRGSSDSPRLYASFLEARRHEGPLWVSASLIQARTQRMFEQVGMAVERFRQFGGGAAMGRQAFLRELVVRLLALDGGKEAALELGVALELGGHPPLPVWDAADRAAIDERVHAFLAQRERSTAPGHHGRASWLVGAHRQRRWLARSVPMRTGSWSMAILDVLEETPLLRREYERQLDLRALVENDAIEPSFLSWLEVGRERPSHAALFPLPGGLEERFSELAATGDETFLDALVRSVREGKVTLRPRPDAGFDDQRLWALEALLRPEERATGAKVATDPAYEALCEAVFRAALTGVREPLELGSALDAPPNEEPPPPGTIEVRVRPELLVEPQLTFYLRHAKAHEFLRDALITLLGEETAGSIGSWTPVGEPGFRLIDELEATANYYRGMAAGVAYATGLDIDTLEVERYGRALGWRDYAFRSLPYLERDPFLDDDVRRVSVAEFSSQRGTYRVIGVLGVGVREARVSYVDPPRVTVLAPGEEQELAPESYRLSFDPQRVLLPYEVAIEFETRHVPTREAWRELVDSADSLETLRATLEERG